MGKTVALRAEGAALSAEKVFFCSVSPGTSSIKASPLRWSITSLSDKEIITIRAAPLHITCSSHAVEVEEMNQWLSICSRSSVSTGFAATGTDFLQAPGLSKSTPPTFWVLDFESQFSCMLGQVSYCWAMSPSLIPLSMPWKQLSVLRILTGMSSPASACSKEPASSETVVPLTLVFRPGSTIIIFSYVSTLYKAIPVLCWWWLIVSVSWTGFGIT